jgi:hypothetical protein
MQRRGVNPSGGASAPPPLSSYDLEGSSQRYTRDINAGPPTTFTDESASRAEPPTTQLYGVAGGFDSSHNGLSNIQQRHVKSLQREQARVRDEKDSTSKDSSSYEMDQRDADDAKAAMAANGKGYDPQFVHNELLGAALMPPLLVMLAFGGRPSLLVLCFGGLGAYIFDVLGSVEVPVRRMVYGLPPVLGLSLSRSRSLSLSLSLTLKSPSLTLTLYTLPLCWPLSPLSLLHTFSTMSNASISGSLSDGLTCSDRGRVVR